MNELMTWYATRPEYCNGWWIVSWDPEGNHSIDQSGDGGFEKETAEFISAAPDMALVLEMLAAEADAGTVMIPSALRLTIDAALIKAGRKAAPVRNGD